MKVDIFTHCKNFIGKSPWRIASSALTLIAILCLLWYVLPGTGLREESYMEEEEGEGIPGIMKAMDLWSDMRTYPNPQMDARPFTAAYIQSRAMKLDRRSQLFSRMSSGWTALGPLNFSGRILCLGFDPNNANVIWAGSAGGGLWKTTNGGTGASDGINWTYIPTGFPALSYASIAIDPNNSNIVYAGTGEVYNSNAAASGPTGAGHVRTYRGSYGVGILKTTDGGITWTKSLDFSYDNLKGIADLAIDPNNSNIVYAATSDGLYRTTDAGASWTLLPGLPTMAQDLCYKPGNSNVLYVGFGDFTPSTSGIYKSTNAAATTPSFTKLSSGLPTTISGKIQLSISANNTSKVYASIGADPNTADAQGMWVSTNEGSSWSQPGTKASNRNILTNQGWYAHDVAADPANAQKVYWGELDMYLSTDGAKTFAKKSNWYNWNVNNKTIGTTQEGINSAYVHADVHRIYATAANTIYMCTDGGIFKSSDGGSSFITLNGGLNTSQIYSNVSISQSDPDFMLGGLQDNEAFVYEGQPGCRRIGSLGDGFHTAIDPSNDNNCFVASYYLNVKKSTNHASSFSTVINLNDGTPPSEAVCFNAPYVICPSNPNIMYAGSYRIRKSTNQGSTWSVVTGALSTSNTNIIYIQPAPTNENIVYVSVAPGDGQRSKLFKTTNGFSSFSEITGTLPDRYYTDIAVDPTDPNRIAVTLSGFGSSHLYMSYDGGSTWSNAGTGLPDVPANTVMFNPDNPAQLYIGNDLGVYFANNVPSTSPGSVTSLTWNAYNEGFDDAAMVSDLLVTSESKLRIATYGRGLWERDMAPMATLPVSFTDFTALAQEAGNLLQWKVQSQSNVARYEVEFSSDGIQFSAVAAVPAKSSAAPITYSYLHRIAHSSDAYYRIKVIDEDGKFEYSVIRMIKGVKDLVPVLAYPNPTGGRFTIKASATAAGTADIQIWSSDGRLLKRQKASLQAGVNEIGVDISSLPTAVYKLLYSCGNRKAVLNLVKQ